MNCMLVVGVVSSDFGDMPPKAIRGRLAKRSRSPAAANFWLLKTEPHVYSITDLERDGETTWEGVRNYQARNFLREMRVGDRALIYHSNASPPAIVGEATVSVASFPDPTALDAKSPYYCAKSAAGDVGRWSAVKVRFAKKFRGSASLPLLREKESLFPGLLLLSRGRLSVMPVSPDHFEALAKLAETIK